MKLAIIGSRGISDFDLEPYVSESVTEIVSGGAKGIDTAARLLAERRGLKLTEFLPEYGVYGRRAPLCRNERIAAYADAVLAVWDGKSRGTAHTVKLFKDAKKPAEIVTVVSVNDENAK